MKKFILLLICICLVGCSAENSDSTSVETTVAAITVNDTTAVSETTMIATTTTGESTTVSEAISETYSVEETTETAEFVETTIVSEATTAETTMSKTVSEDNKGIVIEAEDAVLYGGLKAEIVDEFSGGKGIGYFENNTQYVEFTVNIEKSGIYNLTFTGKGIGSDKDNNINVDGQNVGTVKHLNEKKSDSTITNVMLDKGEHKITLTSSWGWIYLDKMTIESAKGISEEIYDVAPKLVNPNATAETKALFKFLCDSYGEKIISGQVCDYGMNGAEFKAIVAETGKYPAILGLDMMDYSPSRTALGAKGSSVDVAVDFSNNHGGIVAYCWHWNSPTEYLKDGNDENGNPRWWGGFYTRNTDFDIAKVMNGEDSEGKKLLDRDIAEIAKQLNKLKDEGVPVLWRPLHEASGGWFWWGAKGADAYKKLWIYLYEQLTDVYGCDNLIWVYNGQSADWYPGDEYVDIIGEDIYTDKRNYQPQTSKFAEAIEYSGENKIVALTENGVLFDVEDAFAANTKWAWFNTWCGDFTVKKSKYNDEYTDKEMLKEVYGSEKVITLDELPDLKNYK